MGSDSATTCPWGRRSPPIPAAVPFARHAGDFGEPSDPEKTRSTIEASSREPEGLLEPQVALEDVRLRTKTQELPRAQSIPEHERVRREGEIAGVDEAFKHSGILEDAGEIAPAKHRGEHRRVAIEIRVIGNEPAVPKRFSRVFGVQRRHCGDVESLAQKCKCLPAP